MTKTGTMLMAALAAGLVLMTAGCEDSPLTAGSDWTLSVTANPGTVTLDPNTNLTTADVDLAAILVNAKGIPQSGVTVYFIASIPGLASGNKGVKTDAAGVAHDSLHVTAQSVGSATTISATGSSASLKETITINVSTNAINKPPVASIVASPQKEQASGGAVVFDGSASTDPDKNDIITMYRWVLTSTNPDAGMPNPFIAEGPGVSGLSFPNDTLPAFHNVQDLTVSLSVTDDPTAPTKFQNGQPIAYRAQETQVYSIVAVRCDDNTAPTAVISGADQQQVFGFPQSLVSFQIDGSLSSDAETPIDVYNFSCGNGQLPTPTGSPSKVVCKYLVDSVPRSYTAALTVVDRGTGQIVNGQYQCQKPSSEKTITVTVSPLAGTGG